MVTFPPRSGDFPDSQGISASRSNKHPFGPQGTAQIFFSYSAADLTLPLPSANPDAPPVGPLIAWLHQWLVETGFTVWDCQQMPFPDTLEEVAVSRSIEACDNLVVVLSPRALRHTLCLQGLLFAFSMNKRIVPVLVEAIDWDQLPTPLQNLPFVDCQSATAPLAETQMGQQLMQILTHQAAYHQAHTQLLMQSLRWERQQRNPCLLMQGECLRQYGQWLNQARHHPQYPPIRLQTLFIEACQARYPASGWQVHLIHSPMEADYARQLSELLQSFSQSTSFDHLEQLLEGNLRRQHHVALEASAHCLCLVSKASLQQKDFLEDLDYALSLHKPLFVVSLDPAAEALLPDPLQHSPRFLWADLPGITARAFSDLFRLLEHNRTAAEYHAQLLQQALQWERQNHTPTLLIPRHYLNEAVMWLRSQVHPRPTALQRSYIEASQRRGNRWLGEV